ncbi:hypothetical protein GOODEAATRI_025270 [Goodea atripinnis]|uniref:Uncharacterized protein n=1 Tax=Goodea atripinnis TaxID=208336 RepID=A0ABV0NDS8_9TELE
MFYLYLVFLLFETLEAVDTACHGGSWHDTFFLCNLRKYFTLFNSRTNRVRGLIDRLTVGYRRRADYAEIARVKQKEEEPFEEYRIRLTKVFKIHTGLQEDENEQGAY